MPDVRHFLGLPAGEKRLILSAWMSVVKARTILWVVPFRYWRKQVMDPPAKQAAVPTEAQLAQARRIANAVERVSRHFPGASCLTQALATRKMLARQGIECTLRLGVARDADGAFRAHAWIEHAGDVLIGDRGINLSEFVPLSGRPPAD